MTTSPKMRIHVLCAATAGLALRLFFVFKYPFTETGDARIYTQLARNWLDHGVYGVQVYGKLLPVDERMPGYPAFLAVIFSIFGRSDLAVMAAQAVIELAACFVVAAIAARLAPQEKRERAWLAGLWLAALCPFTANYAAVILAEAPTVFLTAVALWVIVARPPEDSSCAWLAFGRTFRANRWLIAGLIAGLATLFRPESPLILIAAATVLAARWWRPLKWGKLARAFVMMGFGVLLPLAPWAARNWATLRDVQFLAPRYSQLSFEFVPHGFYEWDRTWLWRFSDVYLAPWKLDDEQINIDDIPATAFDTAGERERVARILSAYNKTTTITAREDSKFSELAAERTARHPVRTYLKIPLLRAWAMWFTPRVEMLPSSGQLWPPGFQWEDDPEGFCWALGFGFLGFAYAGLAIAGAWAARRQFSAWLLVAFILIRTAYFTTVETPEPRYMLECFPAVIALGALCFLGRRTFSAKQSESSGSQAVSKVS
ncbi:MAG: ArnT family glycosyltransferase [Candidatus Acidiferrales bacterium]